MVLRIMKKCTHASAAATLGLVTDFFNPQLLEGARAYAGEHNILLDARWSVRADWLPEGVEWDGILHSLVDQPEVLHQVLEDYPCSIGLVEESAPFCVVPDYEACGVLAAKELAAGKVVRALVVRGTPKPLDLQFACGAAGGFSALGLESEALTVENDAFHVGIRRIVDWADACAKPVGICLPHAGVAFTLVRALLERGLRIPEDVAIVVIDKDVQKTAAHAPVPLSSVELNDWQRGFVATEWLHQLILGNKPRQNVLRIRPFGIRGRESTGHFESRDLVMAKAISFLRKHYREGITVADVVTAACASRRVVEMRFRQTLNCGVHEEITRLRMEDAKQLLLEHELSATAIAEVCGFSSVHYFSAAFKRITSLSPRQFQKAAASPSAR